MSTSKPTSRQLAFEYLRRLSEELSPADYLKKFEELELEFRKLFLISGGHNNKNICLCEFLSKFCPKYKVNTQR